MEYITANADAMGKEQPGAEDMSNNNDPQPTEGGMRAFFSGASVFVTGGTGFLGKALLEKLLRGCPELGTVFVLMRPKRGCGIEQRYKELLKNPVFERIRSKWPERLEKLVAVGGDVALRDLGMSAADQLRIQREVSVVFHSAATVRFLEPLSEALALNTEGTRMILELCRKIRNLKSVVHVSTAYSNPERRHVGERVYPTAHDPDELLQCATLLPADTLNLLTQKLQDFHPNTYTLTKSLGENVVLKHGVGLPVCIVRPSIITAALSEPYPGWVDNLFGITGVLMEISRGTLRSAYCFEECVMDIVPVDLVVNTCLAAAWHHTTFKSKEHRVYNCTSGQINPITWQNLAEYTVEKAREMPSKYTMMYPNFSFTSNRVKNAMWEFLLHFLPSLMFDLALRAQGKKPIMQKLSRRVKMATLTGEFCATNEWKFDNHNLLQLIQALIASGEADQFNCDTRPIDWKAYVALYIFGIRKFVLNDGIESLPAAKKKLQRLYWGQKFLQGVTGYFVYNFFFGKR